MKKRLFVILTALCAVALMGCEDNITPVQKQRIIDDIYSSKIKTVNYRGHSYILYSEYRTGGGITHDPDCPCREKHKSNI